ncbi:MAG TPA: hypothetical protein VGH91_14890 [Gammaproteobacteria bacterium]|jgi:hypothetical protein
MRKILIVLGAAAMACLAGCATILGDKTTTVTIASMPPGAAVSIVDESGFGVFKGTTPTSVMLEKSTGRYFGGKSYLVTLSLSGYKDQTIKMDTHPNGWYIGGNILLGGIIGWLLVDPTNGGMYTLSPDRIDASLTQQNQDTGFNYKPGELKVMLVQDLPAAMRSQMVKVGQFSHR